MGNPINWFELPATDLARAKAFYEALLAAEFGELITDEEAGCTMHFFQFDGGQYGASGSITAGPGYTPSHSGTLVYFPVPDLDATLAKARALGAPLLMDKHAVGEDGIIALIEDSEGNRIGLHTTTS